MAVVRPVTDTTQTLNADSGARLQPSEFSGGQMVARGAQALAGGIKDVGDEIARLELREQENQARDRLTAADEQSLFRLRDPETGFLNAQRSDAIGENLRGVETDLELIFRNNRPQGRLAGELYDELAERRLAQLRGQVVEHASGQYLIAETETYERFRQVTTDRAITNWARPEFALDAITVWNEAATRADRQGLSGETATAFQQEEYGKFVTGVVDHVRRLSRTDEGGPRIAQEFLRAQIASGRVSETLSNRLMAEIEPEAEDELALNEVSHLAVFRDPATGSAPGASYAGVPTIAGVTPEQIIPNAASTGRPINEGDQPERFEAAGFQFGDGYGARRSGGRTHSGVDMFAPNGTAFRFGRPFRVVSSVRARDGKMGNMAIIEFADGTRWAAGHLPDLPRAGEYEAGAQVIRSGATGNAAGGPPHIHIRPDNDAARSIYNRGRRVVAAYLTATGGGMPSATTVRAVRPAAPTNGSRGDRNNNPGNLVDGSFARRQPGYVDSDGRFARFETREQGVAAQETLLRNNYLNQPRTVAQVIDRYLGNDPGNTRQARDNYVEFVQGKLGVGPSDVISADKTAQLASAMREFETGTPDGAAQPQAAPGERMADLPPPEREIDIEATALAIENNPDFTPARRRALLSALGRLDGMRQNSARARERALQDRVDRELIPLGDGFESVEQLSLETRRMLDNNPGLMRGLTERADNNRRRREAEAQRQAEAAAQLRFMQERDAQVAVYQQLHFLAATGDPQFLRFDLNSVTGLTLPERERLVRMQRTAQQGGSNSVPGLNEIFDRMATEAGSPFSAPRGRPRTPSQNDLRVITQSYATELARTRAQQLGRDLRPDELGQVVRDAVRDAPAQAALRGAATLLPGGESILGGLDVGRGAVSTRGNDSFTPAPANMVPPLEQRAIVRDYRANNRGATPSPQEIIRIYQQARR